MRQQTIAKAESFTGIALHSGVEVTARLLPAPGDTGIVFRRADLNAEIKADCHAVGDTQLATNLEQDGARAGMVEHLLSSLAACQIDNLIVELNAEEVPILDGSAAPWLLLFTACGQQKLPQKKRAIRVRKRVRVDGEQDGCYAMLSPAGEQGGGQGWQSRYDIEIDYPHAVVNRSGRRYGFTLTYEGYCENIARARTFCYINDVEMMYRCRRALGGSLQNAVVYNDEAVINKGGLRYPNEFVRHKMLDVIGDCYINGCPVLGHYQARKPGHTINNRLMRALMADNAAWEWVEP